MAKAARPTLRDAVRETLADLLPFEGRMATSLGVAVVAALVAGIAMMFHIPESALSCYLVMYLMKADGAENTLVASAAILGFALLVVLMIPILQWTVSSVMLRILVMIAVSFVFIFLGAASKLGEGGNVVALIIAFILSLVNQVPINGVISYGLRYAAEMGMMPMFVIAGYSLVFGRWSLALLRDELRQRLQVARDTLLERNARTISALDLKLGAANDEQDKRLMLVKLLHQTTGKEAAKIKKDIPSSYQLLFAVSALPADISADSKRQYAAHLDDMMAALEAGRPLPPPSDMLAAPASRPEAAMMQALESLSGGKSHDFGPGGHDRLFAADAFTNPIYKRFALKTTLAAILCYMFYAAIDWQGIHTAMVTCYVASMGTAGDTIHKLALRIAGCLLGAAIGVASLIFLMPHLESVGGLMILVFAVALLAAWITAGSEKVSYAGLQVGLAFTLTVLHGFGPTTDLDTASDRIIGILVGNFAVYIVSTMIWPVPVATVIRQRLSQSAQRIARIAAAPSEDRFGMIAVAAETERLLEEVRYCFYLLPFEPKDLRPSPERENALLIAANKLASLNKHVYFSAEAMPDAATTLNSLSSQLEEPRPSGEVSVRDPSSSGSDMETAGTMEIQRHLTDLEASLQNSRI